MFEKLKKLIDSVLAQGNALRIILITAFFVFFAVAILLSIAYLRILIGVSIFILIIIAMLVVGYFIRKSGYVTKAKQLAPKQYSTVRMVQVILGGGLLTSLGILFALKELYGVLQYPDNLILFLILFTVGAITGYILGKKLGAY
jgi:hypothetical protein